MGSMIATRFAAAHPHRVRSLTLISTSGGGLDFIPPWKGLKMMLWFLLQRQTVQARADFDLMCHFTKKWMRHHVPHDVPDSPALKNVRPEELLAAGVAAERVHPQQRGGGDGPEAGGPQRPAPRR